MDKDGKLAVFERSLKRVFIDQNTDGTVFDSKIVINDKEKQQYVLNDLEDEISTCNSFFFSVAFLTQSGLNALKTQFSDLHKKGIRGRLLTSNYLSFNSPDVYEDLLKIPNLDVHLSSKEGFHSKGYLFSQEGHYSLIVGSSNLTMNALKVNFEWNIKLTSFEHGKLIYETQEFMENEWENSSSLTSEWIAMYRTVYQANFQELVDRNQKQFVSTTIDGNQMDIGKSIHETSSTYITPNKMQKVALGNLKALRLEGAKRGLVVSATGTGKTYLAAFDVAQFRPKKMLFIVHREQILKKARKEFQRIIGGKDEDFGILSGTSKEVDAKFVFATIQTISKDNYLREFPPNYFDYILIDEAHKTGADTYQKVINYFSPKFLLGMTATPERTDNFDVFGLFDHNIAYEIRLQEALEEDMLAPFHYFGVTDYEKDDVTVDETSDLQFLVAEERVDYVLEKIDYYGCSGNQPKGLIFCSTKREVEELANLFNLRSIPSTFLTGDNSISEREGAIKQLENGELSYIFTVDVFNEGIDIPKVNQIIMLRNTESSIIFIQQLGRGLRKHLSKKFVTIIDFIGNYKNNYMIPMALSGDTSRNKNNLRRDTFNVKYISGVSTVNFEEIAKEKIYRSIDSSSLNSMKELKSVFEQLENRIGRVPMLLDFYKHNMIDPMVIANKFNNYYGFLEKIKKAEGKITQTASRFLMIVSRELLSGIRRHELLLLMRLIEKGGTLSFEKISNLFSDESLAHDNKTLQSLIDTLTLSFYSGIEAKTYGTIPFISVNEQDICLSEELQAELHNDYFQKLMVDAIETGLEKNSVFIKEQALTRYQKYKRKDALRVLNWEKQMVNQNIGGYTYRDKQFVIFVTLHKGEDFKGAQMAYEDEFIDRSTLRWFTKSPRTITSPEVKILKKPEDWQFHVFMKKSDDEGSDFYYLGEVAPKIETIEEIKKPIQDGTEKKVVVMDLKFASPIETNLYQYLIQQ